MKQIFQLYRKCRKSESNFLMVFFRYLAIRVIYNKKMLLHQNVKIKGIKNIDTKGWIEVGIDYVGFSHKTDKTYLNINGKLKINGNYSIRRGCRFDIGEGAVVSIGKDGYMNCNTNLIIMHGLTIGDDCAISWDCQFLDEDFHEIIYANKKNSNNPISIGDHVWIGCGVKIYKGTSIPNGCVIAANSIVRGEFKIENSLIAGNPAKVIKENIEWK